MLMLHLAVEEIKEEDREEVLVVVKLELRTEYVHTVVIKITQLTCIGTYMVNHQHEELILLQHSQILFKERIPTIHQVLLQHLMRLIP